jgi:hypothetical protein
MTVRVRVCRDCCCGTVRKHPDVDHDALVDRLVTGTRGLAAVDITPCLLACERSNVVVVQPGAHGRLAGGRPVWLRGVLDVAAVDEIARWVRAGGPGAADPPEALTPLLTTPGVLGEQPL